MGKHEANEKRAVFSTKGEVSVTQVVRVRITDTIFQRNVKYKQSSTEGDVAKDHQKAKRVGGNESDESSGEFEIASSAKQARSKRSRDTNPTSKKFKNTNDLRSSLK